MTALPVERPIVMPSPFREFPDRDRVDLELIALPTAVRCGREYAVVHLRKWGIEEYIGQCKLVASELITNAIAETGTLIVPEGYTELRDLKLARIRLRLRLTDTHLGLEVWDASQNQPLPTDAADDDEGGRGLCLVEAYCTRWDTYPAAWPQGGKVVWAAWELTP
jgi:anti-sigma regulatory factor (Ser/Thr protein kinase)